MLKLVVLRFLETYFRHRFLYLLPIVIMGLAASAYIATTEPQYVSSGTLYVRKESLLSSLNAVRNDGFVWNTAANVAVIDLQQLIQTEAFVRAVIDETDLRNEMGDPVWAGELINTYREVISFSASGENLVQFDVTFDRPQIANQLAAATIKVYKSWKLNIDQQESSIAQSFFADQIGPYRDELELAQAALEDYLDQYPDPIRGERPLAEQVQIQQYQTAIDTASTRLQGALDKEEAARLAMSQAESDVNQTYLIIDAPKLPTEPETSLKQLAIEGGIFVIVGVMLSVVAISAGALLDRTLRLPLDVHHELHLPLLAMVGDSRIRAKGKQGKHGKVAPTTPPEADRPELKLDEQAAKTAGD